jgi:hypothetical protein
MLIFPDPSDSKEYTDPNGSVWEFNGTGWVRQPESSGGGGVGDLMDYACFETSYHQAGYSIGGADGSHPMQLGSGDFTLQWWIKTSTNNTSLFNPQSSNANQGYWGVFIQDSNLYFAGNHASEYVWGWAASPILDRRWHHIRICRENGLHSLYIDGADKSGELNNRSDARNYSTIPTKGTFWGAHSPNNPNRYNRYAGIQIVRGYSMGAPDIYGLRTPFSPCAEDGAENLLCVNVLENDLALVDIGEYGNPVVPYDNPAYTYSVLDSPYTWNPPMRILTQAEAQENLERQSEAEEQSE